MTFRRPVSLSIVTATFAGLVFLAQPAAAQDFFDWLEGKPAKPKEEETFKGEVPEAVQRDTLPELTPPPEAAAPGSGGQQTRARRHDQSAPDAAAPSAAGEPVPRGPDGQAYDDGNPAAAGAPQDTGVSQDSGQFDPLESRRRRTQGAAPVDAPSPARSQWQNPDAAAPRAKAERYAPGTFEDEQQAMPARQDRSVDQEVPADQNESGSQYDGEPIERGNAPARSQAAPQYREDAPRSGQQRSRYDDPAPRSELQRPAYRPGQDQQQRQGFNDQPRYAPQGNAPARVEREILDGPRTASGAPYDPWSGMPVAELEENLSKVDLPPRSPAIHDLWLRLITARANSADPKLAAIRADALNRTGMIREASEALAGAGDVSADPVIATLAARTAIGAGNSEQGCETARSLTSAVAAKMPPHMKGEVILIAGFCAAVSDNKAAAGIAGDLAIENGLQDHAGPAALKAIAAGHKPVVERGKAVSLLDYRILQLGGPVDLSYAIPTASPALLAVLARDERAEPGTRLAAAEAAAGLNAISIDELAAAYRANADPRHQVELSDAVADAGQPARRAALFLAAEAERTPQRPASSARSSTRHGVLDFTGPRYN